jgi:amino acid transporter
MKDKKKIALLCFLTDLGLSIWSYVLVKNYDEYLKIVKPMIDSPDFQVQLYAVVLQTFIFSALIFLVFHLFIYLLFIREVKYAIKYVRFYTFMAAISAGIMMITGYVMAIIPLIIYVLCFTSVKKVPKNK